MNQINRNFKLINSGFTLDINITVKMAKFTTIYNSNKLYVLKEKQVLQ